jgi:hypothetical protein
MNKQTTIARSDRFTRTTSSQPVPLRVLDSRNRPKDSARFRLLTLVVFRPRRSISIGSIPAGNAQIRLVFRLCVESIIPCG